MNMGMPPVPGSEPNVDDEVFDDLARRAGEALRRPAPEDGARLIAHRGRRQQAVKAGVGGVALATLIGLVLVVSTRVDRDGSTVVDSPPGTSPLTMSVATAAPTANVPSSSTPTVATAAPTAAVSSSPTPTVATAAPTAPATNGWVAFKSDPSGGGDIYLVRAGEGARRLEVAGSETAGDPWCPTWSPDGTRLLFGRAGELVIVPVGLDGAIGAPTVIAPEGLADGACAVWAPDGRWVALVGSYANEADPPAVGEVWVVDTQTGEVRRLPNLRPSDLEWRPGTDQLTIAGDTGTGREYPTLSTPVTVYSVSTGELRQLGSVEAAYVTWSPDGSTMAYQGGERDASELWLVDADGANKRLLIADTGEATYGIGPVWSPTGDRIAYQRVCDTFAGSPGPECNKELHDEVVLVSVADGNQTVIEPPETDGPIGPMWWYPYHVTWSPDGTMLLYLAYGEGGGPGIGAGMIAVAADTPRDVTVLDHAIGPNPYGVAGGFAIQMWGRQPG